MDSYNRKKYTLYSVLGIGFLVLTVFFLYRIFIPPVAAPPQELPRITGRPLEGAPGGLPEQEQPNGKLPLPELPSITAQKLIRLTDFPVISPALNKDQTKILFYKKAGGDLFASDFTGKTQEKLTNLTIIGLIDAVWNRTGDRAIVRYLDNDAVKAFLQVGSSSITVLPQDITSAAWSPDGASLAYTLLRENRLDLIVADATGRSPRTIYRSPLLDASIAWANSDLLIFNTAPSAVADGFLFAFSRKDASLTKLLGPRRGITGLWSPDGASAVASFLARGARGKAELSLSLFDRLKKTTAPLGLTTLSEKCAWPNSESVFCSVPRDIPVQTMLPDEYLRGEFNPIDRIVEINPKNNTINPVFEEGSFDMANLLITKNKEYLFFVNRHDGTLWSLKLRD